MVVLQKLQDLSRGANAIKPFRVGEVDGNVDGGAAPALGDGDRIPPALGDAIAARRAALRALA
jgi:hypothetical protein